MHVQGMIIRDQRSIVKGLVYNCHLSEDSCQTKQNIPLSRYLLMEGTVLFRPSVHVTRHSEKKKFFFFIRLKSKEKNSAISAHFFQMCEHLVEIVQYMAVAYQPGVSWRKRQGKNTVLAV